MTLRQLGLSTDDIANAVGRQSIQRPFMAWIGLSIDMLTMVGLLIAIGIIVDDAIVIAENIPAHHARGSSMLKAAIDGTVRSLPA